MNGKMLHAVVLLSTQHFSKEYGSQTHFATRWELNTLCYEMGVKHTLLRDVQLPTVAFNMLARLCGTRGKKAKMRSTLFSKIREERNFDLSFFKCLLT